MSLATVEFNADECLQMRRPRVAAKPNNSPPSPLTRLWRAVVPAAPQQGESSALLRRAVASGGAACVAIKGVAGFGREASDDFRILLASTKLEQLELTAARLPDEELDVDSIVQLFASLHVGVTALSVDASLLVHDRLATAAVDWLARATALQHLSIDGVELPIGLYAPRVWSAVLPAAARLSTLTQLAVSRLDLPTGLSDPISPLLQCSSLRSLSLHSSFRGAGVWGAVPRELLAAPPLELQSLTFSSNHVDDSDAAALVTLIKATPSLTSLSLYRSIDNVDHTSALMQAAACATRLRSLNLAFRSLQHGFMRRKSGASFQDVDAIEAVLQHCTALHTLQIDDLPMLHGDAERLLELLDEPFRVTRLAHLGATALLFGADGRRAERRARVEAQMERNRSLQWTRVRHKLVPILCALAELELPAYVTLEILQRHPLFLLCSAHGQLIRAAILIKDAHRVKL